MKTTLQIIAGVLLGGFILLFFAANNDWIVIRMPSAPWHTEPSFPIFETRVFALMLACLVVGILCSFFVFRFYRKLTMKKEHEQALKIENLEKELEKANRLIAATTKVTVANTPE